MTRFWRSNLICTLILLALLAIGILTYGFSLRLPLFLDDMPHFRWLQWQTLTGILRSSRGLGHLGYYRPLPFLLWKALWFLQGQLHPPTLHAVNLGLHLLNTILVWGIVKGQCRERGTVLGTASALLFLLYPFSYQAVPWVGLAHPSPGGRADPGLPPPLPNVRIALLPLAVGRLYWAGFPGPLCP